MSSLLFFNLIVLAVWIIACASIEVKKFLSTSCFWTLRSVQVATRKRRKEKGGGGVEKGKKKGEGCSKVALLMLITAYYVTRI